MMNSLGDLCKYDAARQRVSPRTSSHRLLPAMSLRRTSDPHHQHVGRFRVTSSFTRSRIAFDDQSCCDDVRLMMLRAFESLSSQSRNSVDLRCVRRPGRLVCSRDHRTGFIFLRLRTGSMPPQPVSPQRIFDLDPPSRVVVDGLTRGHSRSSPSVPFRLFRHLVSVYVYRS